MNARDSSNQTRDLRVDDEGRLLTSSGEALVATNGDTFRADGATTINYNADNTINYIQIASGVSSYRQTWTWTGGNVTALSGWVLQ